MGLYSLLLNQQGFTQIKRDMSYLGLESKYFQFNFDGIDIRNPINGGLLVNPIFELIDNVQLGEDQFSLISNPSTNQFHVTAGFLADGFSPSTKTRGLNSIYSILSGTDNHFVPIVFQLAVKNTVSQSNWRNGESFTEFWDGVNIQNIPVSYSEYDPNSNNNIYKEDTIDISYPNYRKGVERSVSDFAGKLIYKQDLFQLSYDLLGSVSDGRKGILPNQVFAFENRPEFEAQTFIQKFGLNVNLTDRISFSGAFTYSKDFYSEFDPIFKDNVLAYGDPDQNPNYIYRNGNISWKKSSYNFWDFSFLAHSNIISSFSKRQLISKNYESHLKISINDELSITPGFEFKSYEYRFVNYSPTALKRAKNSYSINSPNSSTEKETRYLNRELSVNNYGYDIYGKETDDGLFGARKPAVYSVFSGFNFNNDVLKLFGKIGYKNTNLDGIYIKNSIDFDTDGYLTNNSIEKSSAKSELIINSKIEYLILSGLTGFIEYNKDSFIPSFSEIYNGYAAVSASVYNSNYTIQPNGSEIKSIGSALFKIGMNYDDENSFKFEGSFFLRKIENIPLLRGYEPERNGQKYYVIGYNFNGTKDIKGLIGEFESYRYLGFKISGNGTYIFNKSGDVNSSNNNEYHYNTSLDYHTNDDHEITDAIDVFGFQFNLNGNSGYPYTRFNGYTTASIIPTETANSSTTPSFYLLDFSADAAFSVSDFHGLIYLKIENLTNKRVEYSVFSQTGSAYDDGYLNTQDGKNHGSKYAEVYNALNNSNNPDFFNSPRTVTVGVKLDF